MQTIETKFLGATHSRGSRIKATCRLKSKTIGYDYSLNSSDNHKAAVMALVEDLNAIHAYDMRWYVVAIAENIKGNGIVAIIDGTYIY